MNPRGRRVHLRPLSDAETDLVLRWRSDPAVHAQLFAERPPTRQEHEAFLQRLRSTPERVEFAIVLHDGTPVGTIGLSRIDRQQRTAEYGILIGDPAARGKGIAAEASELILDYAFQTLGLDHVVLQVFADNEAALGLYRRLGFVADGDESLTRTKDGIERKVIRMVLERPARVEADAENAPELGASRSES